MGLARMQKKRFSIAWIRYSLFSISVLLSVLAFQSYAVSSSASEKQVRDNKEFNLGADLASGLELAQHFLSNRKHVGHILILGSEEFYEQTKQAMELLQRKDPASYQLVNEHLAVIATFTHSGTSSFLGRGIFLAGEPSVTGSLVWYASVLVHEATHVYLYRARKTWQEKFLPSPALREREEVICLDNQERGLRKLGADAWTLKWVREGKHRHYWDVPFLERDW